jgi:hypothetical protein
LIGTDVSEKIAASIILEKESPWIEAAGFSENLELTYQPKRRQITENRVYIHPPENLKAHKIYLGAGGRRMCYAL